MRVEQTDIHVFSGNFAENQLVAEMYAQVLDTLRGLGCDLAQGYHIGRPGTSEQLIALLDTVREAQRRARPRALRSVQGA